MGRAQATDVRTLGFLPFVCAYYPAVLGFQSLPVTPLYHVVAQGRAADVFGPEACMLWAVAG